MSSSYDDDYCESSAWVKQHVESSALGAEWTERARQEKQLLTSALLKMRGRLREEHNKMLKLQQAEAITEEENRLSKRLRDLTREINRADLEILSAMLKAFDVCMQQSEGDLPARNDFNVLGEHKNRGSPVLIKLQSAANAVGKIAASYMHRKKHLAETSLANAISSIFQDIDKEGEDKWRTEVAKVTRGWSDNGEYRKSFEEHTTMRWKQEAELVSSYINDQKKLAQQITSKEMRTRLRRDAATDHYNVERCFINRHKIASKYSSELQRVLTWIAQRDGDEVNLASSLNAQAGSYCNRLVAASRASLALMESNITRAVQIAVLRQQAENPDIMAGFDLGGDDNIFYQQNSDDIMTDDGQSETML